MTDFTPRLLSDADAAADLAGVPRPTEADQALPRPVILPEPSFRLVWLADRGVYKVNKPNIDTTDCYTPDVVRTLVSERDALASRVRELEAALLYCKHEAGVPEHVWKKARDVLTPHLKASHE